jgi:hypothetical protein
MVLTSEFFEWFAEELRFDMMAIMIDDSDTAVDFSWSPTDVERILKLADPYAIEIGLTTWPYPIKEQLDLMKTKMTELLSVGPVAEWETDQEFNWIEDNVEGFENVGVRGFSTRTPYNAAGDYLVNIKEEVCLIQNARDALTTFPYHRESSARADTAGEGDLVVVQAYSVDSRNGKPIHFDHRFGPGRMQTFALDRALTIPGVAKERVGLGIGHAAWSQDDFSRKVDGTWRIEDPVVAMRVAFETALNYPVPPVDHRWWSAKFCYPKSYRYNGYADAFLRTLRVSG